MKETWRPKPGDRIIRHPRKEEMGPVNLTVTPRRVPSRAFGSPMILIYAFVGLIVLGTVLLLLPFASVDEGFTPFMDAFFTATSAVTVTGLTIQDTATYWTRTGQVFILGMMFIGGLGFMTTATFLLILVGQRVTLSQRLLVRDSLGIDQMGGLVRVTVTIVIVASLIQITGFLLLLLRFSFIYDPAEAVWQAVFLAVSGFNNAGFIALTEKNGLAHFQGDPAILITVAALILIGSIGFWVLVDFFRLRRFSLFSLTTKLVLITTTFLIASGSIIFLAYEYNNAATLGSLGFFEKAITALFETISGRTAGFTTVDYGQTERHTNMFFTGLMFIGGAAGSVAGGIKVNTIAIILVTVVSILKGREQTVVFGREIPQVSVRRAMIIASLSLVFVFFILMALSISEPSLNFIDIMFETISAFGTVGLSTGITREISPVGHLIIIFTMFIGRIGPLTIGLAMLKNVSPDPYRYPSERVTIG